MSLKEFAVQDHYLKKFGVTDETIIKLLSSLKKDLGWMRKDGTFTLKPDVILWELDKTEFYERCTANNIKITKLEPEPKSDAKSDSKVTPQERYESVVFWKENVIPFVKKLVDDEIEKEKNHGAEVGTSEKLAMYEIYLNLATEVFNAP